MYLGTYPFAAISGGTSPSRLDPAVDVPGAIRVPANGGWVSTRDARSPWRGRVVQHHAAKCSCRTTERSRARGRHAAWRRARRCQASTPARLIGRVGNSQPFGIGDQASVPMPFDGVLYLAVNDDERADNAGEFVVSNRARCAAN